MKTLLSILLVAAAAHGQRAGSITGAGAPRTEKPAAVPAAGRGKAPAAASAAATGGTGSPRDLKYPPLRAIEPPNAAVFTLANGMKLCLLEDHDAPVIGGTALIRTGSLLDPSQRAGLAQLAAITLRTGGTTTKTGEQIDTLLDNAASTLEVAITDSVGTVSFSGLKENSASVMQLFKEVMTQPGFRPEKIELARTQLRLGIAHRNDNPRTIVRRELGSLVYGKDTPYGWQQEYATVNRVSRSDLRAFHQRYFFPANVTLAVWGDFDAAEMKASIEKLFEGWTAQQPPVPEFPKARSTPAPGVLLAERKDLTQVFVTMGHLGGQKSDKDLAALEVMTAILGGGQRSRISGRLRALQILPNDIAATWNSGYAGPGLFEVSGSAPAFSVVKAGKAIQEEIETIRTNEVTEEELRVAREAAVNRLVFTDDSRSKLFAHQLLLEYYGYPRNYLAQYQQALQSVTRADVLRVAKQYLHPADLTTTVAGNPILFGEPLEQLGQVTKLDLIIPEARQEAMETSDASLAEGKQVLARAQAAVGGAEKLAAVKDYTMQAEYLIDSAVPGVGGAKMIQTDRWVAPSAFRQDGTLPGGRVSAYTDGQTGWFATSQGWASLVGAQRSQMLGDLFRNYYALLLSDRMEGRTVSAMDESSVQITDFSGQVVSLEFDPKTHLPKRVSYDAQPANGPPTYAEDVFGDFREVGGIKVPFRITMSQGGRRFADVMVRDYKVNTGLNPLELARRPQ